VVHMGDDGDVSDVGANGHGRAMIGSHRRSQPLLIGLRWEPWR
jgi:hypothetical protein